MDFAVRKTIQKLMERGISMDAIAHAAGWDEGNRSMIRNGRTSWNEEDWNVAAATMLKLLERVKP